jgi:ABC-type glycerol-3-phosphate transport system substrate-binding protein
LIATEEEEQAAAIRYLNWMMDTERQAEFAQSIYRIPSRRTALDLALTNDVAIAPYIALLENPILPISESESGSLGRLMQDALSSVLTLEQTAAEATAYVLSEQAE